MKRMVDEKEVVKDIQTAEGGIKVVQLDGTSKTVPVSGSGGSVDWSDIQNKPNFATVATTGDYDDLTDKLEAGKDIEINSSNVIKTIYGGSETVQTAQTATLWGVDIEAPIRSTASASPKYYNINDSDPVDPEDPDSPTKGDAFTETFNYLNEQYSRWDKVLFRIVATENDNNTSIGMGAQDEPVAFLRNGNGWDVENIGSCGEFIEIYYRAGSGCWNACVQGNYANGITISEITIIPVQANAIYSKFVPVDNDTIYSDNGVLKANVGSSVTIDQKTIVENLDGELETAVGGYTEEALGYVLDTPTIERNGSAGSDYDGYSESIAADFGLVVAANVSYPVTLVDAVVDSGYDLDDIDSMSVIFSSISAAKYEGRLWITYTDTTTSNHEFYIQPSDGQFHIYLGASVSLEYASSFALSFDFGDVTIDHPIDSKYIGSDIARSADTVPSNMNYHFEHELEVNGLRINNFIIVNTSEYRFNDLPTTDPQDAGRLWNDSGVLKISSGS